MFAEEVFHLLLLHKAEDGGHDLRLVPLLVNIFRLFPFVPFVPFVPVGLLCFDRLG